MPVDKASASEWVTLPKRAFKGSRYRCLLATGQPGKDVAGFLNRIAGPVVSVTETDLFMPQGFLHPDEAQLAEVPGFLKSGQREALASWWLAVRARATTPTWDIASTCTIDNKPGLILVEAKAHVSELKPDDCCGAKNVQNAESIRLAIAEANSALGQGWALSSASRYQLANRFATAWKIASLGVPVVLVYLGFVNAQEMNTAGRSLLENDEHWRQAVLAYARGCVPESVWTGAPILVDGTPLYARTDVADVNVGIRLYR